MGETVASRNKKLRANLLREQLAAKGLVQKVIDTAEKLHDGHEKLSATSVQALKAATDIRLKLINKYMPDVKSVEVDLTGGSDDGMDTKFTIEFVRAAQKVESA